MFAFLKKLIPTPLLFAYHFFLSWLAAFWYGHPSEELVVIGVTGTNGKSTVVNLTAKILETAGFKIGFTSTVNFRIAGEEQLNRFKMTMPGRFFLQRQLRKMVEAGCQYAIIESTSEGVLQHRHRHIHYDCMVFTNLTPEHLERHGGFENYLQAKQTYFRALSQALSKKLGGMIVPKVIVANLDDKHAGEFLKFPVDRKIGFSREISKPDATKFAGVEILRSQQAQLSASGSQFVLTGTAFKITLIGDFNIENCLAAIACAYGQNVSLDLASRALSAAAPVPGRLEALTAGQDFKVIVDYAPEPNALAATYQALALLPRNRLIHILGSTGGGRDVARRAVLGAMAGRLADIVIVTNEDPYDDEPMSIINDVAAGAVNAGKQRNIDVFTILDRRNAIKKALQLARKDDLVLITGKGAEQTMAVAGGRYIPWDDRVVVREELANLGKFSQNQDLRV